MYTRPVVNAFGIRVSRCYKCSRNTDIMPHNDIPGTKNQINKHTMAVTSDRKRILVFCSHPDNTEETEWKAQDHETEFPTEKSLLPDDLQAETSKCSINAFTLITHLNMPSH